MKHADEIPSEGEGRSTRYPRAAVKVFQRLRKESKPGRKPAGAPLLQALPVAPIAAPPAARKEEPPVVPRQVATDTGGIERELAAIRVFLGSIAQSLEQLASAAKDDAPVPVPAVAGPAEGSAAPAPASPDKPVASPGVRLQEIEETGGHRRLHSLPKVWGQRGKRPE